MDSGRSSNVPVCQHQTKRVPRPSDGGAFFQVYSGGIRAAEIRRDAWHIEPIVDDGHPCAKGFMPAAKLQAFFSQYHFTFIAFHRIYWLKGEYHSSWCPFIPDETNHSQGPADLWSNVARNLSKARTAGSLAAMVRPTREQIAALLDNRTEAERLARSISLSLRNIDISVEQIAEFYNEQLVNHMASGSLERERSSSTRDQGLFAYVHSFFMHLGAARDYLAAFCALRIGKNPQKVDSFARLIDVLRPEHLDADDLLRLLHARGYFRPKSTSAIKFESAGWMEEVTELRNEFMHRRPYGDRFVERMGFAEPVDCEAGLYRYVRPIAIKGLEEDVQNVILRHYRGITGLCHAAAVTSGTDLSILTLTDADTFSSEYTDKRTHLAASASDLAT